MPEGVRSNYVRLIVFSEDPGVGVSATEQKMASGSVRFPLQEKAPREGIVRGEDEGADGGEVGPARDLRDDGWPVPYPCGPHEPAGEHRSQDGLVDEGLAEGQLTPRMQARHPRRGARAAGGAIQPQGRDDHGIPEVGVRAARWGVKLNVEEPLGVRTS